jgi:hypothetical protein
VHRHDVDDARAVGRTELEVVAIALRSEEQCRPTLAGRSLQADAEASEPPGDATARVPIAWEAAVPVASAWARHIAGTLEVALGCLCLGFGAVVSTAGCELSPVLSMGCYRHANAT